MVLAFKDTWPSAMGDIEMAVYAAPAGRFELTGPHVYARSDRLRGSGMLRDVLGAVCGFR
jgi:hypothetical protein